ncbi:MAG: hypothetical protein KDA27_23180 [Candidatus Eisenbacteria bacterium]|uniref:Uncharacterized protein n=1 Tax=Eiseniibacteriota bacterium TaxID=2212470 RepID=A0A956NKB2_UNCEI|nr:hypothetical protein [Candidatus Eisenbacteria bacterium]
MRRRPGPEHEILLDSMTDPDLDRLRAAVQIIIEDGTSNRVEIIRYGIRDVSALLLWAESIQTVLDGRRRRIGL